MIFQCIKRSPLAAAKALLNRLITRYSVKEISRSGIKVESRDIDYEVEVRQLIPELKDAEMHTVIFLDEFAEVIYKLKQNGARQDAIDILHNLRAIRSDDNFKHFTVVYGGSIGLESVVKEIDRPKLINDLHPMRLAPLTPSEAGRLIGQITDGATIQLPDEVISYLCEKLKYLLPYYIQLMIEAIEDIACDNGEPVITEGQVDEAFQRVMNERKNFEDWLERLKSYHGEHFAFINEMLKYAAHKDGISLSAIFDMAVEHGRTEDYMDFADLLVNDGYFKEMEERSYRFTSPLLQGFWLKKFPVYHV